MAAEQLTPEERAQRNREKARAWAAANPERRRETRRLYQITHSEELKEKKRAYMADPEKAAHKRKHDREYRKVNAEQVSEQKAIYYQKNKEIINTLKQLRYRQNPKKTLEQQRQYHLANPEKVSALNRNAKARRKRAPGRHTAADVAALYEAQGGLCVGCDVVLIAKGRGKYHVDHIMPITLGGSNWPDNLQLLCPTCNMSKNAAHPDDWTARRIRKLLR
jgi:5-methylcytosine-specific restriction endonuclease McrA